MSQIETKCQKRGKLCSKKSKWKKIFSKFFGMEIDKENCEFQIDDTIHERVCKAVQGVCDTNTFDHPVDQFVFTENYKAEQCKFIEMTEELAEYVFNGGEFYMIGAKEDYLTLCVPNRTFQTKEVEKSNCMILSDFNEVPEDLERRSHRQFKVNNITHSSVDLLERPAVRTPKFMQILGDRSVNIFEDDPVFPTENLTLDQFIISIPMSKEQMTRLLQRYPIFTWRAQFYVLNETSRRLLAEGFCNFIDDTQSIMGNLNKITKEKIVSSSFLSEIRSIYSLEVAEQLVDWLLFMFCEKNEDETYKIISNKVCKEMCRISLKSAASTRFINIKDFEASLSIDLPASVNFDETCLEGIAMVKVQTGTDMKMVRYLDTEDLDLDVEKRLSQLFALSSSWSLTDMEPYFKEFVGENETVFKLLVSMARISTNKGQHFVHPLY